MITLSTGEPSTLGNYRKIAASVLGDDSPAVAFLDRKIAKQGEHQPVVIAESQMLYLLATVHADTIEGTDDAKDL